MAKYRNIVLAAIVAACLAFSAVALAGCGQKESDEDQIRDVVSQDLDQIKNLSDATVNEITSDVSDDNKAIFEMVGLDMDEFIKAFFDGFDYEITDVSVDGDTATATVVCTMRPVSEMQSAWQDSISKISGNDPTEIGQALMDGIDSVQPSETDPITLGLHKDSDGNWAIDDDVESTFANALFGA